MALEGFANQASGPRKMVSIAPGRAQVKLAIATIEKSPCWRDVLGRIIAGLDLMRYPRRVVVLGSIVKMLLMGWRAGSFAKELKGPKGKKGATKRR